VIVGVPVAETLPIAEPLLLAVKRIPRPLGPWHDRNRRISRLDVTPCPLSECVVAQLTILSFNTEIPVIPYCFSILASFNENTMKKE
jgi:hypothetical protein